MSTQLIRYYRYLMIAAVSGVSVFGLLGCSGQVEKDAWNPGPPVVVAGTDNGPATWSLIPVTNEVLPADARIEFPGGGIKNLRVVSVCRTTNDRKIVDAETEWIGENTNQVEIRNLLPNSIWKRLDFRPIGEVTCNFQFSVANAQGSTWDFTLQSVALNKFDRLENFDLKDMENTPAVASDFELLCDHYTNSQKGVKNKSMKEVYHSLAFGDAVDEQTNLSRYRYNHQTCRLAIETFDQRSNKQRYLSHVFVENFKKTPLEITASINFSGSVWWMFNEKAIVLDVRLKNVSPAHVAVRLFNTKPNNLLIQNISRTAPDFYQVVEEYPVTLNYSWSGQSKDYPEVAGSVDNHILEIPPNGTLQINATVTTGMACWFDRQSTDYMRWQLPYPQVAIPYGYAYSFVDHKFIERLLNWDPSAPEYGSKTEDLKLLNSAAENDETGVYPGRSILSHWVHSDQPQNVKVVRTTFPSRSYCNVPFNGIAASAGRAR